MKLLALVNAVAVALWLLLWGLADAHAANLTPRQQRARQAIIAVWPKAYERAALSVSWCESRLYVWATNGQYRGLFQVSAYWRRTVPGWGSGAYAQARHALAVFRVTGSTWAHWSCRTVLS